MLLSATLAIPGASCCGAGRGPEERAPILALTTHCPGLDPGQMEETVVHSIEVGMIGDPSVAAVRSLALDGVSVVSLELVPEADPLAAKMGAFERLLEAGQDHPESCEPTLLGHGGAGSRVVSQVALTGEWVQVDEAAEELRRAWLTLPGVEEVRIQGVPSPRVRITVDPARSAARGVTAAHVVAAVERAADPGRALAMPLALLVDELGDLPVGSPPEVAPRVRDLSDLELERTHGCGRYWIDGEPAAIVTAVLAPLASAEEVAAPVSSALSAWVDGAPGGLGVIVLDGEPWTAQVEGDVRWLADQLPAVERAATAAGATRTLRALQVPRSDALTCDPDSEITRVLAWWGGEPAADPRPELRRAIDGIPAADGHVRAPGDRVIELLVTASDPEDLRPIADAVRERLTAVPGLLDVWGGPPAPRPEVRVHPDALRLAAMDLRAADVVEAVQMATEGIRAGEVTLDGRRTPVQVAVAGVMDSEDGLTALRDLGLLLPPAGPPIPVAEVADIELTLREPERRRVRLGPAVSVFVGVGPADEAAARVAVMEAVQDIPLPEGAWIERVD